MKYPINQERELMTAVWSLNIKDDPLNFVKFAFPWGMKDTPLEDFKGPRKWQEKILREMTIHIARNGTRDLPEMFRMAVASGRGIGKVCFGCMDYSLDVIHKTRGYHHSNR